MSNKKTFEDNLKQLEEVVTKLETGNLGLDEAIEEFEKGMKLSKECTKKLDEAEKRINILVENENGDVIEEKFEVQ